MIIAPKTIKTSANERLRIRAALKLYANQEKRKSERQIGEASRDRAAINEAYAIELLDKFAD